MLIFFVLLIAVVVIAVFIWNYRRQAAAREAASAERMKAFLDAARATTPQGETPAAQRTPAAQPAAQSTPAARPRPEVSGLSARAQFMSTEQAAFHALLKSALPEHEVFARVSLAAFIQPADNLTGFAREAQERRLADTVVDFLVCDKSLKSVAAVHCGSRGASSKGADTAAFASACVESTGLRWVEVEPQPLPGRADLRRRVLGN